MKTIVCAGKILGVYQSVDTLKDALLADGTVLPLAALGSYVIMDSAPPSLADSWDGKAWIAPPPDTARLQADASAAIQHLLDSTAQAHGYDDLERAISYIGDAVAKWDAEGVRAKAWRSECWSAAKVIQDNAIAGNWPTTAAGQLPSVADVLAAMPAANWPA